MSPQRIAMLLPRRVPTPLISGILSLCLAVACGSRAPTAPSDPGTTHQLSPAPRVSLGETVFVRGDGPTVYLLAQGELRPIANPAAYVALGGGTDEGLPDWSRVTRLSEDELRQHALGAPMSFLEAVEGAFIRGPTATVFHVVEGRRWAIYTEGTYRSLTGASDGDPTSWGQVLRLLQTDINRLPLAGIYEFSAALEGAFVKGSGQSVHLIRAGRRWEVVDEEVYVALGGGDGTGAPDWTLVRAIPGDVLRLIPAGSRSGGRLHPSGLIEALSHATWDPQLAPTPEYLGAIQGFVELLGSGADQYVARHIATLLHDSDPDQRLDSARRLSSLFDERTYEPFIIALTDPSYAVSTTCRQTLERRIDDTFRYISWAATVYRDRNVDVQREALTVLYAHAPPDMAEKLRGAFTPAWDTSLRLAAVRAWSRMGTSQSLQFLVELGLPHPTPAVRRQAAISLAWSGTTEHIALLETRLTAEPNPVVTAALEFAIDRVGARSHAAGG